jgi:probable HAF family extracellular repeat protein
LLSRAVVLAVSLNLFWNAPTFAGREWIDLGTLGGAWSTAQVISADGQVVAGISEDLSGHSRAFRWTEAGGMADLGTLGGLDPDITGISADGQVIIGNAKDAGGNSRAFRWTDAGGIVDLGSFGGGWSECYALSAEGLVVVGSAKDAAGNRRAFRWTLSGGMVDLSTLTGTFIAKDVSADGHVVVGDGSSKEYYGLRAFRWTAPSGMVDLGIPPEFAPYIQAVSADGVLIIGTGQEAGWVERRFAFYWTQSTGMVWLKSSDPNSPLSHFSSASFVSADGGAVVGRWWINMEGGPTRTFLWTQAEGGRDIAPQWFSEPYGISADGSVIVGKGWGECPLIDVGAFRWTASEGFQTVKQWLGISDSTLQFTASSGVSADGKVVIGKLGNGHAFLARQTLRPSPATLISPSGAIATNAPDFAWNAVSDADQYYLWVNDSTGKKIKQWYSAAEAGCANGKGMCAVRAETALADGSAEWWIQTGNIYGYGLWSASMVFTVVPLDLPGKASLISPSGILGTNKPAYTWNAVSNASEYRLWVADGAEDRRINQWYSAAQAGCPAGSGLCSVTPEPLLVEAVGKWWIQAYNSSGLGPWSDGMAFTATAPGEPSLIAPSGVVHTNTPTYTWKGVANSTWYYLWVVDSTGKMITQWYTAAQTGCSGGSGLCSIIPDNVAGGAVKWWIQTWNSFGYGLWSDPMTFTAPAPTVPAKAELLSPSGNISTNIPTYTWNAASNSTWYYLWVVNGSGNTSEEWFTASQAGCPGGSGTCSVTPDLLVEGTAQWWVQTWNSVGYGPWSDGMTFTVPTPTSPGKATLVSPSGSISTSTPTYIWNPVSNSTWYLLWVDDGTNTRIDQWYEASQAGCSGGTGICSVTPETTLAAGSGKWWIQTWNPIGSGPWSDAMTFSIPGPALPGKVALVSPSESINTNTPVYTWNADAQSAWYFLWVDDDTGTKIKTWYSAEQAGCSSGKGACSVKPDIDVGGAATWWIQTRNLNFYGPWSDGLAFTAPVLIRPGKPILLSPSGTVITNTPTYVWNAVPKATQYLLSISDYKGTGSTTRYSASAAGCSEGTGVCSVTPGTALAEGFYYYWTITAGNSVGCGPSSDVMAFQVNTANEF